MIALLALICGLPEVLWLGGWNAACSAGSAGAGGGPFLDRSSFGALENPAYSCFAGSGVDLTGSMVYSRETRTRTVYDTFGGVVGESEQAFNQGIRLSPGGAAGAWGLGNWGLAAGIRALGSFHYDYRRTARDESYVPVSEETVECRGTLWEFGASAGYSPAPGWALGVGGGVVAGNRSVLWSMVFTDPAQTDLAMEEEEDVAGAVLRASGETVLGRVRLAAGAALPLAWTLTDASGVRTDLDDALEVKCGVLYLPGDRLRSRFSAEASWRSEEDPGLRDTWGVRGGVESLLPGGPVTRFGFDYSTSPIHRSLDAVSFTAGLGFRVEGWDVDAGVRVTPSGWRESQISGLPGSTTGDSLAVETLTAGLVLGISRNFGEVPPWR